MKTYVTMLLCATMAIFMSCNSNGSSDSGKSTPSNIYEQMTSEGWTYCGEVSAFADGDLPKIYHLYYKDDKYVVTLGHKAPANSSRYPITQGKYKASVWGMEPQSCNGYFNIGGMRMYLSF